MWEPLSNLTHTQDAIDLFHRTHPSAPRRIQSLSVFQFRPIINYTTTPEGYVSSLNHND
jgi:hypothetical protein